MERPISTWLNKIEPAILYQSVDLPYIILDDGVKLVWNNSFSLRPDSSDDHSIAFKIDKTHLKRESAYSMRLRSIPYTIPFSDVISLDDAIIDGKFIKHASTVDSEDLDIAIVRSRYIDKLNDDNFQDFVDTLESYDKSFILIGDNLSPQVRLIGDIAVPVRSGKDWGRICTAIAHEVCPLHNRKYCWTKSIPDLSIAFYGLRDTEEVTAINNTLNEIGIQSFSLSWEV